MKYIFSSSLIFLISCSSTPGHPPGSVDQFLSENPKYNIQSDNTADFDLIVPQPIFPMKAVNEGQQGWCLVEFSLTKHGVTEDHKIVACNPKGYFERAALISAKHITVSNPPDEGVSGLTYTYHWKIAR